MKRKGRCPVCDRRVAVTAGNYLRKHNDPITKMVCAGSFGQSK
jgi:hypothetical protein